VSSETLPQRFGRYTLVRLIGEGGMAEVYLATLGVAEGLSKRFVVKKIRKEFADEQEFTRMFVDEAKIALGLNHANIVQVFDFGQVDGVFFLAMELVEGTDLMHLFHAVRESGDRFPSVIAAYVGHQVASGLAYAHSRCDQDREPLGIVHRDTTPHNIMVSLEGQVKILDFGIARTRKALEHIGSARDRVEAETIKGKVAYMSPEQATGLPLDGRSDLYSLGVVLHELLSGELLFRHKDRLLALERVRTESIPLIREVRPDVPEDLARIIDHALQRETAERYESARAMQADLAAYLHHSDPVVDDEVLSKFVAKYYTPDPAEPGPTSLEHHATRELGDSHGSQFPVPAARESQRVVLVHVALEPRRALEADPLPDPGPFLKLAENVAFKREAHVVHTDERSVQLAIGTVLTTGEDAERALRLALALREEVGEVAPGVAVGIAVASAQAIVEHGAGGPIQVQIPVEIADHIDRLARRSMEGPVLVAGDLAERLSRTWRFGEATFVEPPEHDLPHVDPDLTRAAPLVGLASESERHVRHVPGGRLVLYGREIELKALRDNFSEAIRTPESRAVVVIGQPGLGKRALVERFVSSLPRTGCWVLRGAGRWSRRNVPLGVFLELLGRFFRADPSGDSDQIVSKLEDLGVHEADKLGEALASALGVSSTRETGVDPLERRDRISRLVRRLIRALARRRPVLVLLENLHFLDEQSITLMREWLEIPQPLPVLGLSTGRPGPRVDQVRAFANVGVIELKELDDQARRNLILDRFEDSEGAKDLCEAIVARAGGNPLFIEETLASLLQRGVIGWNPQGRYLVVLKQDATIGLPPSIEAVLQARMEDLSFGDREVLHGAAVLGRFFAAQSLSDLLRRSVGKSVDSLVDRNMLERIAPPSPSGDDLGFTTMSLHEVCRSSIPAGSRPRLHRRAAELKLHADSYVPGRDDGPIADHLITAGDVEVAVDPALRAAQHAREVAGNVEAYYYLSRAIEGMERNDPRRFTALLQRESILRAWGRRRAQGKDIRLLMDSAEQLGDTEKEVIASIRLLRFYLEVLHTHKAERLVPRLERRIESLDEPKPFLAALGELKSDLMLARGRFEEAERIAHEALAHCSSDTRGERQRCRLVGGIGKVQLGTGRYEEAAKSFQEALSLARSIGDKRLQAEALNHLGASAGRSTRYQEAVDYFREAIKLDRDLGDRFATGAKLGNMGMTYAAIGLYRRAERYLRKALELHEATVQPDMLNRVVVHLGEVVAALGDPEAARTLLDEAARAAAGRGDLRTELRARIRLAQVMLDSDDEQGDAVAQIARHVLETARAEGLRTARCRALHVLALLAARTGDRDQAIAHEREAVELVRHGAAPMDGVLSLHHLGELLVQAGDESEGQKLLQEAEAAVKRRADALRDDDLRAGYLAEPSVKAILTRRAG
jgi:serine/threonine protein kinase/tetratricopeptide (TPR) repeat protein